MSGDEKKPETENEPMTDEKRDEFDDLYTDLGGEG